MTCFLPPQIKLTVLAALSQLCFALLCSSVCFVHCNIALAQQHMQQHAVPEVFDCCLSAAGQGHCAGGAATAATVASSAWQRCVLLCHCSFQTA
jgi:hypothetical protein